ncbi:hypothetical protein JMJ77_0012389, partial [Colletotrichum scovillei]
PASYYARPLVVASKTLCLPKPTMPIRNKHSLPSLLVGLSVLGLLPPRDGPRNKV